ncbi:MAG: hypothetical protein QF689_05275 [Candidatus Latescibacteria bacterium]|jgi:hypothetical protein|nr:hypothetical protein [Gemmatimonadaceae bacterium]MDP6017239.1 hypothetical protein [Candidatus Latescibacterota bacterium]MDP7447982.1 hypothetical protein [Candidatus Latescibacterota bacterium]HJP30449.1 hypothetical protein [Candidatus Latescibacterota bacterium]
MVAATLSLPLRTPLVQSYLFHAYPLAVLAGHGDASLPWVLTTFVQLYHRPGDDLKFYAHPWSPGDHLRQAALSHCPWLDVQQIDQRLLGARVIPFLEHCLDRGLYPQIDIDYGCLPWDTRGQWLHEILLCGIDRRAGVFEALAYTHGGLLHTLRIDSETVAAAAVAGCRLAEENSADDERPRLLIYRYIRDASATFDLEALCDQLWDYLESADSSSRHRTIAPVIDALWGTNTCSWLTAEILAAVDGASADRLTIPLRVWWEHKRLMTLRFDYLESEGYLDPAMGAGAAAREIAACAWQVRLITLRWHHGKADGVERIAALLRSSAARELDTAGAVVNALL